MKRSAHPQDGGGGQKISHVYKQSTTSKPQKKNKKLNMVPHYVRRSDLISLNPNIGGNRIVNEILVNIQTDRHFAVTLRLYGPFLLRN